VVFTALQAPPDANAIPNRARVHITRHLNDQHNIVISEREPSTLDLSAKLFNRRSHRFNAQVSALKSAGCEKIFREKASGGRWSRPELNRLLDQLRNGDVLVVWRLDRLSRSLRDVLMIIERIKEAEAGFRSLTEAIDTTTAPGRMMMQM
jgi:DNA invertase Pin-like site-specific DNA recombinase